MAIPFLNHLDLLDVSEIQNAILHKTTSAVATGVEGKIIYDTGTDSIKFYNGSTWLEVSTEADANDIDYVSNVTFASNTLTFTGVGNAFNSTVDLSTLADTVRTVAVDTNGDGAVNNTLLDSENLVLKKGTNITLAEAGGVITISSTDTNTQLSQEEVEDYVGGMLDGTETGITVGYDDTNGNIDFVVADTTVAGDTGSTGITPGDTLTIAGGTNVTTAMSGDTLTISSTDTDTQLTNEQVQDIVGAMFSGNTETRVSATYQDADGTIDLVVDDMTANTDVDVSNANLLTRLAALESSGGAANENIVIGADTSDTIVITGNLQVSGTTTTVNSTEVVVADNNIVLSKANNTAAVINGAGITLEGGTGDDATFTYSTTGPKFELKLGSAYEDLQVDKLIAATLDISGDADIDGTLEADAITVNGSTLNSVIDDRITAREYKANFPSTATSAGDTITITHNLGTRDVIVQFYALVADIDGDTNTPDVIQYEEVKLSNTRATDNTITVAPNTALVQNALRVLIKEL